MAIYAGWLCQSGIRRTSAGFVHDLSVIAESPDGIDRVEFALSVNGSPGATLTATSETIRTPNFSGAQGLMPGCPVGEMSSIPGWGVGLDLSTVAAGTIVVTATAFDSLGGSYVLPETMTVYNDTDGGDRRPRTVTLYADGDAGNDANNGTSWAQAVRTPMRAVQLGRHSSTGDIGGLVVHCRGTFTDLSGGIFPETRTTGAWWCEWRADAAGAWLNVSGSNTLSQRTIYSGTTGGGVTTRHRWIGFRAARAPVSYNFGGTVEHWMDGCWDEATGYLGAGAWHVDYAQNGVNGFTWGNNGPGGAPRMSYTGCRISGALLGFEQSRLLLDCVCEDFIGIATKAGNTVSSGWVCANYIMRRQRYRVREVQGFVRMDADPTQGKGRPALTISKPTSSTARITGPVGGYDFSLDAAGLAGSTRWGLRFSGAGAGLDSSSGRVVTAVGNSGGAPWVEVTAPDATAGSIGANTASFWTAQLATGPDPGREYWYIHPDGIQIERAGNRDLISDCAIYDCDGMQSYFTSGNSQNLCLWRNLRDDGSGGNSFNWAGSSPSITNAYLKNLTIVGPFSCNATVWTGTVMENCIFGSAGGNVTGAPAGGATVRYCHWISGATVGTNATSGAAWYASDPTTSPFPFEPATKGNGSPSVTDVSSWAYSGSGSTRGVLRNVGDLDWSLGSPAVNVPVGPGSSAYQSTRYTATINGTPAYVHGYARATGRPTIIWAFGEIVEQSWLRYTANGTTTVRITKLAGPITSAICYPGNRVTQTIVGGVLELTVPAGARVRVEIDGDRKHAMHVFAEPIPEAMGPATDWTTLSRPISAIDTGTNVVTMAAPHGWSAGQRVVLASTGALPAVTGESLSVHEALWVVSPSGSTLQLARTQGGTPIDFVNAGTGTLSLSRADWTSGTLYFPPGVHVISRAFQLSSDVKVFLHLDALVIGSFDFRNTDRVLFDGPGQLWGLFQTPEWVHASGLSFFQKHDYTMLRGYDLIKYEFDNEIRGIMVVAAPWAVEFMCCNRWRNVTVLTPWYYNDGLAPMRRSPTDDSSLIEKCFIFTGDDVFTLGAHTTSFNIHVRDSVAITCANSCVHLSYWAYQDLGYTTLVENCDFVHFGIADRGPGTDDSAYCPWGGNALVKAHVDGFIGEEAFGRFRVTLRNNRVWGEVASRLFHFGNRDYMWDWPSNSNSRAMRGQIQGFVIENFWVEQVPGQSSDIFGIDATNRPRDIAWTNLQIAGVNVTAANARLYFTIDQHAENITFDGVRVDLIRTTGAASVAVGAAGASGLLVASIGGVTVPISAAGAAALLVGAVGSAAIPIAASGFSTLGVVPPPVVDVPMNVPRGPGVRPWTRRRLAWWTWVNPWV